MSDDGLTPKQQMFVAEYLVDKNATRAAIKAGYSEKTAYSQGQRLLKNVEVAKAIETQLGEQRKRLRVESDTILRELLRIARSDIRNAFNDDNSMKEVKDMPASVARAVASVEVVELPGGIGFTKKIKFWPKTTALEMLGRHLKLFTDKIEVEGVDALAERMKAARERRNAAKKD